jgi:hypothetical protein
MHDVASALSGLRMDGRSRQRGNDESCNELNRATHSILLPAGMERPMQQRRNSRACLRYSLTGASEIAVTRAR